MAIEYELIWSKRAEQGFDRIVKHLEEKWTNREVKNFIQESNSFFEVLRKTPNLLQPSRTRKSIYRGPINKLTILTYRIKPKKRVIELVNIRSARQKPLKK